MRLLISKWKCLAVVLALQFPLLLGAQDVLQLNLEKALEIALSNNPTIKIADKEIEKYKYGKKEIQGALLPSLTADGSYRYGVKLQSMPAPAEFGGGTISFGRRNDVSGTVTANMPLFMASIYKSIQLSDIQIENSLELARSSRIEMINQVKTSYYLLLLSKSMLTVWNENLENAEEAFRIVKASYDQEMVPEYDVIRAEVAVKNLKPNILDAENGILLAEMMLKMYLSLPQDVVIDVTEKLEKFEQEMLASNNQLVPDFTYNTDLRQLNNQERILQKQFEIQRTQRYPTLSAFGNYTSNFLQNDFRLASHRWLQSSYVGLQLSVPIFSGFTKANKEKQIKVSIDQLEMQRSYFIETLSVQYQQTLNKIEKSKEQIESDKEAMRLAQRGYEISEARYKNGAGTILELNDTRLSLSQSKLNYNQAIYDYLSARAEYEKLLGSSDTANQPTN